MLVISNTSPLLYLHRTGNLDLLRRLYGRVYLPPAVRSELAAGAVLGISVPSPSDHEAKRVGLLSSVATAVADLRAAGLWIGEALAANVIAAAGEGPPR